MNGRFGGGGMALAPCSLMNDGLLDVSVFNKVIQAKDMLKFSRMIMRATKGNSIQYTFNIPNDFPKEEPRAAFILIL